MLTKKLNPKKLIPLILTILFAAQNAFAVDTDSCPGLLDINAVVAEAARNQNSLEFVNIEYGSDDNVNPLGRILEHSALINNPEFQGVLGKRGRIFFRDCNTLISETHGITIMQVRYEIDRSRSNVSRLVLTNGRILNPGYGNIAPDSIPAATDQNISLSVENGILRQVSHTTGNVSPYEACSTNGLPQGASRDRTVTSRLFIARPIANRDNVRIEAAMGLSQRIANLHFQGMFNQQQRDSQIPAGVLDHRGCVRVITEPRRQPTGGSCSGCHREPSEDDVDGRRSSFDPVNFRPAN